MEELYDFSTLIHVQDSIDQSVSNNYSDVQFENTFQSLEEKTQKTDKRDRGQNREDLTYINPLLHSTQPLLQSRSNDIFPDFITIKLLIQRMIQTLQMIQQEDKQGIRLRLAHLPFKKELF